MFERGVLVSVFENRKLVLIILMWMMAGIVLGNVASFVVAATAALLLLKRMYMELFLGFALILFVADSREAVFRFARDSREMYAIIMAAAILFDKGFYTNKKLYTAFIPFFIIASVALYYSPVPLEGALRTFSYFLILFIVPPYIIRLHREYGVILFRHLISMVFLIFAVGLVFSVVNPGFVYLAGRYSGLLGNPNGIGLFVMLTVMLFEIVYERYPEMFKQKERIFFLASAFFSVILAASRTAMMSLIIFYTLKYTSKISRSLTFFTIIAVAIFAPLIIELIPVVIIALNLEDFARLRSLEEMGGRVVAIEFAWNEIQNNFWLGRGFGYSNYLFDDWAEFLSDLGHQGGTHNTYITIWLNTGLIGMFFFLGGWFSAFIHAYKSSILAIGVGCAVLFSIFFETWLSGSLNAFTIILIAILTTLSISRHESHN